MKLLKSKKGFTLIELLVVIGILAVLDVQAKHASDHFNHAYSSYSRGLFVFTELRQK